MPNRKELIEMIISAEPAQRTLYSNLYKTYNLINKNYGLKNGNVNDAVEIDEDTIKKLNELETKVYTVNGKPLTERQKISLELSNIADYLEQEDIEIPDYIEDEVHDEIALLKKIMIREGKKDDPEVSKYVKKHITLIQGYLGINIKFFEESINVLNDEITKFMINKNFAGLENEADLGKGAKGR